MSIEKKGNSGRMEALTDGIFAIASTLLVLEIHLPAIHSGYTRNDLIDAMIEVLPSFVAFAISFITILTYWLGHELLTRVIVKNNFRLHWMNLILLFWIALIPFPTKLISELPMEPIALFIYGAIMLMPAITSNVILWYIFKYNMVDDAISSETRQSTRRRFFLGPALYAISLAMVFIHVYIAIAIFIVTPILFFAPVNYEKFMKEMNLKDE